MVSFYVRVDEPDKTAEQLEQRERTYAAAKVLCDLGYEVEVREWFTGKSQTADAASIVLKLGQTYR